VLDLPWMANRKIPSEADRMSAENELKTPPWHCYVSLSIELFGFFKIGGTSE